MSTKTRPLKKHESISIFSAETATYNPQMEKGEAYRTRTGNNRATGVYEQSIARPDEKQTHENRYPGSVLHFPNMRQQDAIHPTQKPVALMQYLIRTYTNPGDTVLDFTCGSGTTLLAAKLEGRKCIGIERDTGKDGECLGYCEYAVSRLAQSCMVFV